MVGEQACISFEKWSLESLRRIRSAPRAIGNGESGSVPIPPTDQPRRTFLESFEFQLCIFAAAFTPPITITQGLHPVPSYYVHRHQFS